MWRAPPLSPKPLSVGALNLSHTFRAGHGGHAWKSNANALLLRLPRIDDGVSSKTRRINDGIRVVVIPAKAGMT